MKKRFDGVHAAALAAVSVCLMIPALAAAQVGPTNFGDISNLNESIGDTFNLGSAPTATGLYNFVDVYTFTFEGAPQGVTSGSVIDFSYSAPTAITNLQAAVFTNGSFVAGSYPGGAGVVTTGSGSTEGDTGASATVLGAWTSGSLGPTGSLATFSANLVGGTTYEIEIRGTIGSSGDASYGGDLGVAVVPEPSTLSLLPFGLAIVGAFAARALRARPRD